MATHSNTSNQVHNGYMDGLNGLSQAEGVANSKEYVAAYLIGCEDRKEGVKPFRYAPGTMPALRGKEIVIPQGTPLREGPRETVCAGLRVKVDYATSGSYAFFVPGCKSLSEASFIRPKACRVEFFLDSRKKTLYSASLEDF